MKKVILFFTMIFALVGFLAGCGSSSANSNEKITIGYFPNINHVPAMVAKSEGFYEEQLGDGTTVEYKTFPDGSAFMTALKTGEIQAGLVGPGPAMNNYSTGADVAIIGGGSTGGTVVLARADSDIESIEDLPGKTFVTPRVGCTHDVQFETYMEERGVTSNRIGGEMVHTTGPPAQYQQMFETGKIDVAVAPEPWAAVLQQETGAKVIIDSTEVSFGTTLPASVLVTSGEMIDNNPEMVQKIVNAHKDATAFIKENPEEAKTITIDDIKEVTDQELSREVIDGAWENIDFTYEVNADAIQAFGESSFNLEFLQEKPDYSDLIDTQFIE